MDAGAKNDIVAAKCSQLGDAQPCLDGDEEKRAIASPDPSRRVGGVEQRLNFVVDQVLHDPAFEALARDREDPLAQERVGRLRERDETEESMERRKAGVSAAGGVAALLLEMIEKVAKEGRIKISEREARGGTAEARGGEAKEQAEGVAVGCHRVWARLPRSQQAVGEERLQERRKIGGVHGASRRGLVARSVASWRSSGTASMYQ
jgi:hypothetical protein